MLERLQKILSAAGISSRRASERLILEGRVTVNGVVVDELGTRADRDADDIRVDGRAIESPPRRYILLNKPRGYITSRSDPEGRPTVLDLVPGVRGYLYPVGRLDYDSEGLLILTNDGSLAERLMHPRYGIEREYEVIVKGRPGEDALRRLREGIALDGRRTAPANVKVARAARDDRSRLLIVLHEGRSRQIRKMCEAVGHPVVRLRRVRIGPITDPQLKPGASRELTKREVAALGAAAPARSGPRRGRKAGPGGARRSDRSRPPNTRR